MVEIEPKSSGDLPAGVNNLPIQISNISGKMEHSSLRLSRLHSKGGIYNDWIMGNTEMNDAMYVFGP